MIPPSPQRVAVIPQKGGEAGKIQKGVLDPGKRKNKKGKKVREEKRGQVAQPSRPLRYREARSAVRSGPLKGPSVRPSVAYRLESWKERGEMGHGRKSLIERPRKKRRQGRNVP